MSEPQEPRNVSPAPHGSGDTITSSYENIEIDRSRGGSEGHTQFASAVSSAVPGEPINVPTDSLNTGPLDSNFQAIPSSPPSNEYGQRVLLRDQIGYYFIDATSGAEIRFWEHWTSNSSGRAPSIVTPESPTPSHGVSDWGPHPQTQQDEQYNQSVRSTGTSGYLELVLDIEPDTLTQEQIGQLSAIRAQLGLGAERLRISTALMAEHQQNIDHTHDAIHILREETASRLLSINNDINNQRSRLNRCLDDNIRVLRDSGLAEAQLKEIMTTRGTRAAREMPPHLPIARPAALPLPPDIRAEVIQTIPPRRTNETPQDFIHRGEAMGRTKERAHTAFAQPYQQSTSTRRGIPMHQTDPSHRDIPIGIDLGSISTARIPRETHRVQNIGIHQTTSTYRAGMNGNVEGDAGDLMADFDAETYDAIIRTIDGRVGREPEILPSGVRAPRLDPPPKYSGSNNHDEYIAWLEKWLRWLRSQNICGPQTEQYRITLLGLVLDGPAHDWFIEEVDNPRTEDDAEHYSFADSLCALHRRFVHFNTAHQCSKKFDDCVYISTDGPEGFYNVLMKYAIRMRERPTEYNLRKRLMDGYPAWIHNDLVRNHGITSEYSSLMSIRTHARQLWESSSLMRKDHKESTTPTVPGTTAPAVSTQSRLPRPARHNPRPNTTNVAPRFTPAVARDDRGPIPKLPPAPTAKTCYTCGLVGHFANDPQCPKYSERTKPRFAAQRIEEVEGEDADNDSDNGQGSWGSSQYTSADEDGDEPIGNTSDDATVRIGAMRPTPITVRCNMMRVEDLEPWMARNRRVAYDAEGNSFEAPATQLPCPTCGNCEPVMQFINVTEEDSLYPPHWLQICSHLAYLGHPDQISLPGSDSETEYSDDENGSVDPLPLYAEAESDNDELPELITPPSSPPSDTHEDDRPMLATDGGRPITSWTRTVINYRQQDGPGITTFDMNAEIVQFADDRNFRLRTSLGWTDWYVEAHPAQVEHPSLTMDAPLNERIPRVAMLDNGRHYADPTAQLVLLREEEYSALAHAVDNYQHSARRQVFATRIVHSSTVRRRPNQEDVQPNRHPRLLVCLTAEITINGVRAYALFDSGSTTDSISPEFAYATKAPKIVLKEQVVLQLGCVGSKSKINFGTRIPVLIGTITDTVYFDIVNLDRYDCIIGTPFLNKYGACLDFGNRMIRFKDQSAIAAHSIDEEREYLLNRTALPRTRNSHVTTTPEVDPRDQPPHFRAKSN